MASSCEEKMPEQELRLVLVGKTGCGKSATGNTLLNKPQFSASACGSSVTANCSRGETVRTDGRQLLVVDTPGLFDTNKVTYEVTREICKCFGLTSPGPHAILLIIGIGRFTQEEQDTVKHLIHFFGDDVWRYMVIVFTGEDRLQRDKSTIEKFVKSAPADLRHFLGKCNNRYIALNNHASDTEKERKIDDLISLVDNMVQENGGVCFTNETYEATEAILEKRMEEIRGDLSKTFKRDVHALQDENEKLDDSIRLMRQEAEEQKHLLQTEAVNHNRKCGGKEIEKLLHTQIARLEKRKALLDQELQMKERQLKLMAAGKPIDDRIVRTEVRNEVERNSPNVFTEIVQSLRRVGRDFLRKALNYFQSKFF